MMMAMTTAQEFRGSTPDRTYGPNWGFRSFVFQLFFFKVPIKATKQERYLMEAYAQTLYKQ